MAEPLIDIRPDYWNLVSEILRKRVPEYEVWAFGSRAKWSAKEYSDLDLAVITDKPLSIEVSAALSDDFSASDLPFKVDVVDWATTSESFRKIIERDKVVVQKVPTNQDEVGGRGWLYRPEFSNQWQRKSLYLLAQWVNGLAFRDIQFSKIGKLVIKIAEIKGGISGQSKFTTQTFEPDVHVTRGDLLFSWSGQPETSIDVFWWQGLDGWLNQHIFKINPYPEVDRTFFYYLLRYLKPNFIAIARNKQTTGLGHVTKQDLKNIEVAYPSIREQHAIANILGKLDDKIENNRRMNVAFEAMAQSMFKSWFVDPIQNGIPKGWREVPLPEAIEVNPFRPLRKGDVMPYLDMANMPTRSARALEIYDREFGSGMRFKDGDTLVARITPCLENGKTCFVDFLGNNKVGWGSTEYIVFHPKPPLPPEFAYFLARTDDFRAFAISNMTGSSGRQRVPAECFKNFPVFVPPVEIAERFGRFAKVVFEKMKSNDEESSSLATIRDALLPRILSGKMCVDRDLVNQN